MSENNSSITRSLIAVAEGELEVFQTPTPLAGGPVICAAHPAEAFVAGTAQALSGIAKAQVVCVNPKGIGQSRPEAPCSLEQSVDDLEAVRQQLKLDAWFFWGMSGGGWLAQVYARRYPQSLRGIIIESACSCFAARLADPLCVLSPRFQPWQTALNIAGMIAVNPPANGEKLEWTEVKGVGQVLRRQGGGAVLVSPVPVSPQMARALPGLLNFDSRPWLGELDLPALILAGTHDPVAPFSHVKAVHDRIPHSIFVAAKGGKHVPSQEKCPEFHQLIQDFVAGKLEYTKGK